MCGVEDDEPRHSRVSGLVRVMCRHFVCCAATGCPDGSCDAKMAEVA